MRPEGTARQDSLEEVIREEDFLPLLEAQARPFFLLTNTLRSLAPPQWEKGHLFRLVLETNELESFLDDFGARKNRTFGYLAELVATLRWLAQACFTLTHLSVRLVSYRLDPDHLRRFRPLLKERLSYLESAVLRVIQALEEQFKSLGLRVPASLLDKDVFGQVRAERYLPENLGEEEGAEAETKMAEITARYLAVNDMVRAAIPLDLAGTAASRQDFVSRFCREEQLRVCLVSIHNLQSRYDTYIKGTPLEAHVPDLPRLRGHISAALHLIECATALIHLDERHQNDIRTARTRQAIASLVDRPSLLSLVTDFCLAETQAFLEEGAEPARSLLQKFMKKEEIELKLPEGVFLHARPASLIVAVVNHYGMPVEMEIQDQKANASSIMAVMILAGKNPRARKVKFRGDRKVLQDLKALFASGLGTREDAPFPESLSYLRNREPSF